MSVSVMVKEGTTKMSVVQEEGVMKMKTDGVQRNSEGQIIP